MHLFENIYFLNACFAFFGEYLTLTQLFVKCWFLFLNKCLDNVGLLTSAFERLFSNNCPDTENKHIIFNLVNLLMSVESRLCKKINNVH